MFRNLIGLVILVVIALLVLYFFGLIDISPEGEAILDEAGDAAGDALEQTGDAIQDAGNALSD